MMATRTTIVTFIASAALQLVSCCCCDDACCDVSLFDGVDLEPRSLEPTIDLGTHSYPTNHTATQPTEHRFAASRHTPANYRIGYALSPTQALASRESLHIYARTVNYAPIDDHKFVWTPGPECQGDMRCVLETVAKGDRPRVLRIAEALHKRAKTNNMSALQAAELVVSFVQSIRYEIPKKEPFGILPPALVMSESRGDCDSKALLALMILRELHIDSILISSRAHQHTMLGIALPSSGQSFTYEGRRYAFVECTAKGSPIGHVNRKLLRPNDWRAVSVRRVSRWGTEH